ncbi:MAG TPA: protein-L-isoaspartate O-methyltransferase [Devosia sp.]
MTDFARARTHMIDSQLRTSGITNKPILARMGVVPREKFVPESGQPTVYTDSVQWLGPKGQSRFIAPPAIFAKLLQLAEISNEDSVLDIGAGTGYSTFVIAGLAAAVAGFEPDQQLAETARANLAAMGATNASIVPQIGKNLYDLVFVEGMLIDVPDIYLSALKDGGRLVAPVWSAGVSVAKVLVKSGKSVSSRTEFNATLPPLLAAPAAEFLF